MNGTKRNIIMATQHCHICLEDEDDKLRSDAFMGDVEEQIDILLMAPDPTTSFKTMRMWKDTRLGAGVPVDYTYDMRCRPDSVDLLEDALEGCSVFTNLMWPLYKLVIRFSNEVLTFTDPKLTEYGPHLIEVNPSLDKSDAKKLAETVLALLTEETEDGEDS